MLCKDCKPVFRKKVGKTRHARRPVWPILFPLDQRPGDLDDWPKHNQCPDRERRRATGEPSGWADICLHSARVNWCPQTEESLFYARYIAHIGLPQKAGNPVRGLTSSPMQGCQGLVHQFLASEAGVLHEPPEGVKSGGFGLVQGGGAVSTDDIPDAQCGRSASGMKCGSLPVWKLAR
ncbi:hypothetical protein B0T21DRAFT_344302 [Apiosordaria backusii]|uniref:Uncharacterized protein n=1 Tax=Apiosordaria backusii TaxID=314023 RepID=A0AA40F034_9PEZI|nr:hypothetical protein B0T21DRAFT_344302 [Apiosordaria backusii]